MLLQGNHVATEIAVLEVATDAIGAVDAPTRDDGSGAEVGIGWCWRGLWPLWCKHVAEHLVAENIRKVLKEGWVNLAVTVNRGVPQDHRGLLCRAPSMVESELRTRRTRLALELALQDCGEEPVMVDKGNHVIVGQEFLCESRGAFMRPVDALELLVYGLGELRCGRAPEYLWDRYPWVVVRTGNSVMECEEHPRDSDGLAGVDALVSNGLGQLCRSLEAECLTMWCIGV